MTIPVHIAIRTAVDWRTLVFSAQTNPLLDPFTKQEIATPYAIPAWEEATGREFRAERHAIQQAARRVIDGLGADRVTTGLDNAAWLDDTSDDAIIMPIDDDDTFDPAALDVARQAFRNRDTDLLVWKRRINYLGEERFAPLNYLDTCNWAIRLRWLQEWSAPMRRAMVAQHWTAHVQVCRKLCTKPVPHPFSPLLPLQSPPEQVAFSAPNVRKLAGCYSTYYLHSASISFLLGGKMQPHADRITYLRSLPKHPLL